VRAKRAAPLHLVWPSRHDASALRLQPADRLGIDTVGPNRPDSLRGVTEPMSAIDVFAGVTGALVATAALVGGARTTWTSTVGSRRVLARKVEALRVGMSAEHMLSVFGPPTFGAVDRDDSESAEGRAFWALDYCYLAGAFNHGAIVGYSIVTTDRWFHPRLAHLGGGQMSGRLGAESFMGALEVVPGQISCYHGASTMEYAEHSYLGRPGGYCDYVLAASTEGYPQPAPPRFTVGDHEIDPHDADVQTFRRTNRINTVTVSDARGGSTFAFHNLLMERVRQDALRLRTRP
jgi:hypothetical protein